MCMELYRQTAPTVARLVQCDHATFATLSPKVLDGMLCCSFDRVSSELHAMGNGCSGTVADEIVSIAGTRDRDPSSTTGRARL